MKLRTSNSANSPFRVTLLHCRYINDFVDLSSVGLALLCNNHRI